MAMYNATQLQFNLDHPMNATNLSTQFTSPRAIVFEQILSARNPRSPSKMPARPVRFSALSSCKLSEAMQLARRDIKSLRRKKALHAFATEHQLDESVIQSTDDPKPRKTKQSTVLLPQHAQTVPSKQKTHKMQKHVGVGNSDPNVSRNSAQKRPRSKEEREIHRLRLEVEQIVLHLEKKLKDKEISFQDRLVLLDPDEQQRTLIRHMEQMRKSSRTVYNLQQQIQAVKDELNRQHQGRNQTNGEKLLHRLGAAYRGTARFLQTYSVQLPEHLVLNDNFVAVGALYQEVSRLVRELLLCSLQLGQANVEEVEGLIRVLKEMEPKGSRTHLVEAKGYGNKDPRDHQNRQQWIPPSTAIVTPNKNLPPPPWTPLPKSPVPPVGRPKSSSVANKSISNYPTPILKSPRRRDHSPHIKVGRPKVVPAFKQVKLSSTPVARNLEREIDLIPQRESENLADLKHILVQELEDEVRSRIQPLLEKADEIGRQSQREPGEERRKQRENTTTRLHGSENQVQNDNKKTGRTGGPGTMNDMLEDQVRDIIDETRKEMKNFQAEEEIEEAAVHLHQAPHIETLLHRLDVIEREEETIRRHWRQINYDDMRHRVAPFSESTATVTMPTAQTPRPFTFTNHQQQPPTETPKNFIKFVPTESPSELIIGKRPPPKNKMAAPFTGTVLTIPPSTVKAISNNKTQYGRYLKLTCQEAKGKFDPWKLVDELSDGILKDVIASVTEEVNGMCEEYAQQLFQREFADASNLSESSSQISVN